jgi:hypothetical protein
MSVVIYKVTRQGRMALKFEGKDGTQFLDPNGLKNPQLARIVGSSLMKYVRCEVGNGLAEVLGEASAEEVAAYEGRGQNGESMGEADDGPAPFKFPGA